MDNEAVDVKWEVVIEDDKQQNPDSSEKQILAQGGTNIGNMCMEEEVAGDSLLELGMEETAAGVKNWGDKYYQIQDKFIWPKLLSYHNYKTMYCNIDILQQ